jgi:(E)-4-hydroxy-3-methylbut-2-enyl-diphosphate synthase
MKTPHHHEITHKVKIGNIYIGNGLPIRVQSMTNTETKNVSATIDQIQELESVGCEIIRVSVPDEDSAKAISKIKPHIKIPLVADIHFNYRLALLSIENGADKIRINPGNIGPWGNVEKVVKLAKKYNIAIRIGINSGSFKPDTLPQHQTQEAIKKYTKNVLTTVKDYIRKFEQLGFRNIVVSAKCSDVLSTVEIYRALAKNIKYPLHLGITEAGSEILGTVKSSIGLGILLKEGIGDTIRVSLTDNPIKEVEVGYYILRSLGLRKEGIEVISCPTCARCKVDLIKIVNELERLLMRERLLFRGPYVKLAVMGCVVNGPGEAKHADLGVVFGKNRALFFKHGEIFHSVRVNKRNVITIIVNEIKKLLHTRIP